MIKTISIRTYFPPTLFLPIPVELDPPDKAGSTKMSPAAGLRGSPPRGIRFSRPQDTVRSMGKGMTGTGPSHHAFCSTACILHYFSGGMALSNA